MNSSFENVIFYITLIIYFILNIANTIIMLRSKKPAFKLLFAVLPFPLLFVISSINVFIFKAVVDISNPPFGTDYSGYFMGLVIIMGMIMVAFYILNFILICVKGIRRVE